MITNKQLNSMIRKSQQNDFAPVRYHVVDYRNVSQTVTFEPVHDEVSETTIAYYTDRGYTVTVEANEGQFAEWFTQVYKLIGKTAEVKFFTRWNDAAKFVKENFKAIETARSEFYQ